jgi:hypothetical protein
VTPHERLDAVARFGFTTRQAGFLVTVMRHSGVCLPRQYAAFAGIAYGHKTNAFFGKLESRRIASTARCLHNRAVVYRVHHLVSGQPAGVSSAPRGAFQGPSGVDSAAMVPTPAGLSGP